MANKSITLACVAMSIVLAATGPAFAQATHDKAGAHDKTSYRDKASDSSDSSKASDAVRIRKVTGVGAESVVKTPEFKSSSGHGVKQPQDWGEIAATFDTSPDWIDSLTLHFYVLAQGKGSASKTFSMYQLVVRYPNVAAGKSHMAAVYVLPAALDRYGSVVAVGVEALVDEQVVASDENKVKSLGLPEKWWTKPAITEKDTVKSRDGYLKKRSDTPFELVDFDDYEVSE